MGGSGGGDVRAEEVKEALKARHPAVDEWGRPGAWTTLEEFANIDLLAFSAWSSAKPPIVGYEVKISRSDYRRELLNPSKRAHAVAACHAFYFVTPKGLLTKDEKAYVQPEHFENGGAFVREPCPSRCISPSRERWGGVAHTRKWGRWVDIDSAYGDSACRFRAWLHAESERGEEFNPALKPLNAGGPHQTWEVCETCEGRGYLRQSVVEQEAPTLWIPPDCGLIEVNPDTGKCRTVRKAPVETPTEELGPIGHLVRRASFRPDPRHIAAKEQEATAEGVFV
jgi:hypothetical protein